MDYKSFFCRHNLIKLHKYVNEFIIFDKGVVILGISSISMSRSLLILTMYAKFKIEYIDDNLKYHKRFNFIVGLFILLIIDRNFNFR
jgi:hypothetical protein